MSAVRLAVFDLDSTVLDCESQELLIRFLAKERIAPAGLMAEVAFWFGLKKLGWKLDIPAVHARLVGRFATIPEETLRGALERFAKTVLVNHIRKDAADWIARLKNEGCHIVLVSASLDMLVSAIATETQAHGYSATRLSFDGPGKMSVAGEMVYGEAKVRFLHNYAQERFSSWRLEYAFGNDYSDRFLLSGAAVPVAVCPSPRLREHAEQQGWATAVWN